MEMGVAGVSTVLLKRTQGDRIPEKSGLDATGVESGLNTFGGRGKEDAVLRALVVSELKGKKGRVRVVLAGCLLVGPWLR